MGQYHAAFPIFFLLVGSVDRGTITIEFTEKAPDTLKTFGLLLRCFPFRLLGLFGGLPLRFCKIAHLGFPLLSGVPQR